MLIKNDKHFFFIAIENRFQLKEKHSNNNIIHYVSFLYNLKRIQANAREPLQTTVYLWMPPTIRIFEFKSIYNNEKWQKKKKIANETKKNCLTEWKDDYNHYDNNLIRWF